MNNPSNEINPQVDQGRSFTETIGDLVALTDHLGFEPYVEAVADFLTSPVLKQTLRVSLRVPF
jgi:hypothetical protein